jgi:GNAT superfamily N-acetyltransferase
MKITIKKMDLKRPTTQSLLTYLQKKCLPYDTPYETDCGHWWIAFDETNKPVGFAGLVRSSTWYNCGYLCRAGVITDYRGKGLQKRLVRVRLAKAKKLGWDWAITDTTANPPSSNSLINQGFKLYEPTKPWAYKHSLYWRKKLNAVQRPENQKTKAR